MVTDSADAVAAATRIIHGSVTPDDVQLVAGTLLTTLAYVAKLGPILESVGLSHSQAMQIVARMKSPDA